MICYILYSSETGHVLTIMKAGDFFGEIGILNLDGFNKYVLYSIQWQYYIHVQNVYIIIKKYLFLLFIYHDIDINQTYY